MPSLSPSGLSFRQTIIITALAASLGTTAAILSFQALRRDQRTERLKKEVGRDVEEWEKSRAGTGMGTPEERVERWAEGEEGPEGGRRRRSWAEGEFDEGLIREQVGPFSPLLEGYRLHITSCTALRPPPFAYTDPAADQELQLLGRSGYGQSPKIIRRCSRVRRCGFLVCSHASEKVCELCH